MIQPPDMTSYFILGLLPTIVGGLIGGYLFIIKDKEYGMIICIIGVAVSICFGFFIITPIGISYEESFNNEIENTDCDDLQSLSKDYESLKYWYGSKFKDKIQSIYLYNCLEQKEVNP